MLIDATEKENNAELCKRDTELNMHLQMGQTTLT